MRDCPSSVCHAEGSTSMTLGCNCRAKCIRNVELLWRLRMVVNRVNYVVVSKCSQLTAAGEACVAEDAIPPCTA